MLFVIATKLDVFLQLTPEMQTHLPQPLNRISFGIILRTQAPGCDEDEGSRLQKCRCTSCCLWMPLNGYVCVTARQPHPVPPHQWPYFQFPLARR
ncbi:uncharacterized protein Dsimw501_GD29568 [Drosophila simulans]|uniref:Uncharacterized protein n=1 Tax=Drosophila simulans TaxID=7240 RepID=A0A0J9U4G4_DROSI|nr:uncharacterized protein Dsimw501_GD29568 [Drosophila simulans]